MNRKYIHNAVWENVQKNGMFLIDLIKMLNLNHVKIFKPFNIYHKIDLNGESITVNFNPTILFCVSS